MLIVTGAREGEVLSATWDQFDLKRGIWTKPSHHTKQKKIEHTPLSDTALQLLRRMHVSRTSLPLFPGQKGARVTIRRPWSQVCKAARLATSEQVPGKRKKFLTIWKPAVRIHDLRQYADSRIMPTTLGNTSLGRAGPMSEFGIIRAIARVPRMSISELS